MRYQLRPARGAHWTQRQFYENMGWSQLVSQSCDVVISLEIVHVARKRIKTHEKYTCLRAGLNQFCKVATMLIPWEMQYNSMKNKAWSIISMNRRTFARAPFWDPFLPLPTLQNQLRPAQKRERRERRERERDVHIVIDKQIHRQTNRQIDRQICRQEG